MTDYRATPEAWAEEEKWVTQSSAAACLLELRSRVEALEANSKPTPNFSQIRSSLVERVQQAINTEYEESLGTGSMEARAAICEVAAFLREIGKSGSAVDLERQLK